MLTHRCNRFMVLLTGLRHYTTEQLLAVMQDRRYPPLLRVAALRWLIHWAPPGHHQGRSLSAAASLRASALRRVVRPSQLDDHGLPTVVLSI